MSLGANDQGKRVALDIPLGETAGGLGAARNLRIVKEGRTYFAVVTFRRSMPAPKPIRSAVGLDPNHKNFAYGVGTDGKAFEIQNLAGRRDQEKRIDKLKSKRDRCTRKSRAVQVVREDESVGQHWEPSRRWNNYDQAIQRAAQKMRDQTKHFLFAIANRLCRDYDLIGVGDYAPGQGDVGLGKKTNRAMRNRSLLGRFKPTLLWVARRSGKSAEVFDETGTTRTCSEPGCGHSVAGGIPPDIREWTCGRCRTTHLRDENAAKNGLARMLRARSLHLPCSGPVQGRCDWCFHPQGWREAVHKAGANANQTGCPGSTGPAEEAIANGPLCGVIAPDPRPAQV